MWFYPTEVKDGERKIPGVTVVLSSAWVLTDLCHLRSVILIPGAGIILNFGEEVKGKNENIPHLLSFEGSAAIACLNFGEREKAS